MQVDPIKPKLKPPGTNRLKLNCDVLVSTSAFKFNLRCYTKVYRVELAAMRAVEAERARELALAAAAGNVGAGSVPPALSRAGEVAALTAEVKRLETELLTARKAAGIGIEPTTPAEVWPGSHCSPRHRTPFETFIFYTFHRVPRGFTWRAKPTLSKCGLKIRLNDVTSNVYQALRLGRRRGARSRR